MRFDLVTAHAFGALRDAHLELRSGLNVVYGGNESGKSTWHAALYAGLCGRRRGHPRKQDREFEKRRRPWSGKDTRSGKRSLSDTNPSAGPMRSFANGWTGAPPASCP